MNMWPKNLFMFLLLSAILYATPNFSYGQSVKINCRGQYYYNSRYRGNHLYYLPVFIDGKLKGLTNQVIELENGEHSLVVHDGENFYGDTINHIDRYSEFGAPERCAQNIVNRPTLPSNKTKITSIDSLSNTNYCTDDNPKTNIKYDYSDSLVVFSKKNKYGYKDKNGNVVIKAKYQYAEPFIKELNCAIVKKGDKFGIINVENEFIIKPQYLELKYIHRNHFLAKGRDRSRGDYCGIIDTYNNNITDFGDYEIDTISTYYICYYDDSRRMKVWDHNGHWFGSIEKDKIKYLDWDNNIAVVKSYYPDGYLFQNGKGASERYDDVQLLTNNTYLTSIGSKCGFIGIDGKQIVPPVFSSIDIDKWENGKWQLAILEYKDGYDRHHRTYFMLRYDNEINEAEILSMDQFVDKYGDALCTSYIYITNQEHLDLSGMTSTCDLNVSRRGYDYYIGTYEELSGDDSYVHKVLSDLDLNGLSFKVLDHIVYKKRYLYIINDKKICKKIAFSQMGDFAGLSGADIRIDGISTLSNGDILLKVNANTVDGYYTYMRDPVYLNIQGQLVAIDHGGSYRSYYGSNVTAIFILDGKTFDLKHSRIMPHEYDNIYVSKYNGFFAYKLVVHHWGSGMWSGFEITEDPLLKFTNSGRDDWSFVPREGEGISCMYENEQYIYMGGYTKNKGYVGYKNPYICKLDIETGSIIKSHSYKLQDRWIDSFKDDCAWTNKCNIYGDEISHQYSFSLLYNIEEGNIKLVDVAVDDFMFTGLVYNDKYWLIPPVFPGSEKKTYAEWEINPPVLKYDNNSKKTIYVHSEVKKNNELVNVDKQIVVNTK